MLQALFEKTTLRRAAGHFVRRVADATSKVRATAVGRFLSLTRRRRRHRALGFDKLRPVTLFIAPEAGLLPHFMAHAISARALADAGHATIVLSCNGSLPICGVKFTTGVGPTAANDTKNPACVACRKNALSFGQSYDLVDMAIDDVLDADQRAEISRIVAVNAAAPWLTEYDGILFGAACLGETMRFVRKSWLTEFTSEEHELLKSLLVSSLAIYVAARELTSRFKIERIAYYGDYAYHLPLIVLAGRRGIAVTHLSHVYNGDIDRRHISLRPGFVFSHVFGLLDCWHDYRRRAINPEDVDTVIDGALYRLSGHGGISTFSPNWVFTSGDLRTELGLDPGKKTIVAYSSSMDEFFCTREFMKVVGLEVDTARHPFVDQDEWLKALVDWVGSRADVQLVLRLHPRLASNVRYSSSASDLGRMREMLSHLPPNVMVAWPESKVSSYNLAEIADVVVTAWSSMAIELSTLGIPVASAFPRIGLVPTGSFIVAARTPQAYLAAVERLLHAGSSIDAISEAIRWVHLLYWSHVVDVADLVPTRDFNEMPVYRTPRNSQAIVDVLARHKDVTELTRAQYDNSAASIAAERAAVVWSLEVVIALLSTGQRLTPSQGLRIETDEGDLIYQSAGRRADLVVKLAADGMVTSSAVPSVERYSRLVLRLARALEDETRQHAGLQPKSLVDSH